MNLWNSLLVILKQEPIYSLLLVSLGSLIVVINRIKKKDNSKALFTAFLLSFIVPLLITFPLCEVTGITKDFKPLVYFILSLFANEIIDGLETLLKSALKLALTKENLNKIIMFFVDLLLKLRVNDSEKKEKNDTDVSE